MAMVTKVIEISSSSKKGIEDAVQGGLKKVDLVIHRGAPARHAQREAKCMVSISDHLIDDIASVRTLWTNNHPTLDTLRVLFERLCAATWGDRIRPWEIAASVYSDPFSYLQMPIHLPKPICLRHLY